MVYANLGNSYPIRMKIATLAEIETTLPHLDAKFMMDLMVAFQQTLKGCVVSGDASDAVRNIRTAISWVEINIAVDAIKSLDECTFGVLAACFQEALGTFSVGLRCTDAAAIQELLTRMALVSIDMHVCELARTHGVEGMQEAVKLLKNMPSVKAELEAAAAAPAQATN